MSKRTSAGEHGAAINYRSGMFALDSGEFAGNQKRVVEVVEQAAGKKLERIVDSDRQFGNSIQAERCWSPKFDQGWSRD